MNANLVAQLDCLCSFTQLAIENMFVLNWTKHSEIKTEGILLSKSNYRLMPYIANDVFLIENTAVDYDWVPICLKVSYFASNRADCTLITNGKFCPCRKRENGNCR
jgi:hypothetical protein